MIDKKKIASNFGWRFAERFGAQVVKFIVEIILARLLMPEDYGLIALVTVIITILNVFVDSGLGISLIQKKDADDIDFSTVFFFNIVWCCIIYVILFLCAPYISLFYGLETLTSIIRVLGLTIVVSGIKNVQQAYVSRTMQFKKFFFSSLIGTIGAAILGIILAFLDFGVWALVIQQLFNTAMDCIVLWITVEWRPKFFFSIKRLKLLFSYGWKILFSTLLNTIYNNIYQLIIGNVYSSSALAFYNKGDQFPKLFISNINDSIDSVLLPSMSLKQDNITELKYITSLSIRTSTYLIFPLMIGLSIISSNLVLLVLTKKWIECVPYLQCFCVSYMLYPIHTANLNAIKAKGRSDIFLKLEIIKKVIGLVILFIVISKGPLIMAYSLIVLGIISQIINSYPNKHLLNYGYIEQIKDIIPNLLISLLMGINVYLVGLINMPLILLLLFQVTVGIATYIYLSYVTKNESFKNFINILKRR